MSEDPKSPPGRSPDAAPKLRRRDLLRSSVIAGGIAGAGGLAGLAANKLGKPRPAGTKATLGEEFSYDVSMFQKTDPALVRCEEAARFPTGMERPRYVAAAADGSIWVAGDGGIRKFTAKGEPAGQIALDTAAWSLALWEGGRVLVGQKDKISVLTETGGKVATWQGFAPSFLPTGLVATKDAIYVADAKNRVVLKLDGAGKTQKVIGERSAEHGTKGFVVPSPYFCLRLAPDGLLRVSNPGAHQIEAYTLDGAFEVAWGKASFAVEGFCGCCNPVSFDLLPDGGFVTCEKGLPRVKLYNSQGEFTGLVAGPDSFPEYLQAANGGASETASAGLYAAVDPAGRILVLDSVGKQVRIYTAKDKSQAHA